MPNAIEKLASSRHALVLPALLSTAGYFMVMLMGDVRPHVYRFLGVYAAVFLTYLFAATQVVRSAGRPENDLPSFRFDLPAILIFAVFFRLILLWDYPFLADDIYRYLWDGRVWSHGVNPYLYAPASEQLAALRDLQIHPFINHAEIPTIYAPVLQFIFRFVYKISPTFIFLKAIVTLFDFGTIALLLGILKILQKDLRLVLLYAWNPLVIVETAGSGHIDSIGVFFLAAFFFFWIRKQPAIAVLALALATLTKFIAVILLPFILWQYRWKQSVKLLSLFLTAAFLAYLPFLDAGAALYKALSVYTTKWLFNASIFRLIFSAVEYFHPSDNIDGNLMIAKYIGAAIFTIVYVWLFFNRIKAGSRISNQTVLFEWLVLFGTICILSPTLHPWYLVWLVPVLIVFPNRAWIFLTGLIFLSYAVLDKFYYQNIWQESTIILLLIYLPFYALLIFDFWQNPSLVIK